MNTAEFIEALEQIEKEKGIDREDIFEAIETAIVSAYKKNFGTNQNVKVVINRETGEISCYAEKVVVEKVEDKNLEISLEEARTKNPYFQIGDIMDIAVIPKNFGRVSAQTAKQVVVQKFREAERKILYNQYINKEKDVVTGIVQRRDKKNILFSLEKLILCLHLMSRYPEKSLVLVRE